MLLFINNFNFLMNHVSWANKKELLNIIYVSKEDSGTVTADPWPIPNNKENTNISTES